MATMEPPSADSESTPSKAMLVLSSISGSCTRTAREFLRTTLRRQGGSSGPPSKTMPTPRSVSGSCTTTARECPRTMSRRSGGTDRPPSKAMLGPSSISGPCTAYGEGVPQDYAEAARWYRQAAEQGHADAQLNLGIMYDNGQGVPQDDVEAVRWYRQAAEQGHAGAQFNLGTMYDYGEGVPQDYAEAARWYRQAAEQGDADAQLNLGIMYDNGQGVPQDDVEAVRWYRQAAEQGDAKAQFNLGLMYEYGEGVLQNFGYAHKWFNLAASLASSQDRELREKAVKARDRVASQLTAGDLAIAQRLAREWQPRDSRGPRPVQEESPPQSTMFSTETDENGNTIANLQRSLLRLGYYAGPLDGELDTKTRMAIRSFEADSGLPITGQVSEMLHLAVEFAILIADTPNHSRRALTPTGVDRLRLLCKPARSHSHQCSRRAGMRGGACSLGGSGPSSGARRFD